MHQVVGEVEGIGCHAGVLGQERQLAVIAVTQAIAVSEPRAIGLGLAVQYRLRGVARPGERQLAAEVEARPAGRVADQHVGNAAALGPWQPDGDESVGGIDLRVGPQRATGQEHRHHRHTLRPQALEQDQVALVAGLVLEGLEIAPAFGIRRLADYHHRDVGLLRVAAVDVQLNAAAAGFQRLAQAGVDRLAVGEIAVAVAGALPGQGPAAALAADVVGAGTGHQHPGGGTDRQHRAIVLQQHQRLAYRLARQRAVLRRAEHALAPFPRAPRIEHAQRELDAQDAAHGIVDALRRNLAGARLLQGIAVQGSPAVRCHQHVDAGVEGCGAAVVAATRHLSVRVPVADDEAVEAEAVFQHVGQQAPVAVHLHALPAGEGGHHRHHTGLDRNRVALRVDADQLGLADIGVTLVDAATGAAVGQEMLGRGRDMAVLQHWPRTRLALEATHHRVSVLPHQAGLLGITLVVATPAQVARHR